MKTPSSHRGVKVICFLAVCLAGAAIWRFHHVLPEFLDPDHWLKVIRDPVGFGGLLGGLVSGLLTVTAGLITILIYVKQQRSEQTQHFFQWIENFSKRFHQDHQYSEVRETLARKRDWVRRQICQEMLEDGDFKPENYLECDRHHLKHDHAEIDWRFLRLLTDYLYFFEQLLAFGEVLEEHGSAARAPDLVNHFGWFLRSLCISWSDKASKAAGHNPGEEIFIRYLALNRYRRLAEVSLVFYYFENVSQKKETVFFDEIMKILQRQVNKSKLPLDYTELRARWVPIIGDVGFVHH